MENLKGKKILITGGTGSFGKALTKSIIDFVDKIYIFSRDELKQWEMQKEFNNNKISFIVGDIRDKNRLYSAFNGIDYIVHAAAQKHVPSCENNPFEAINTNIIGAKNIIDASIAQNVKKVIALSTDKAVEPINLYGSTKLCMEKLFLNANNQKYKTIFSIVRYGNVIGSRGSIIPLWKKQVEHGNSLSLTDKRMTRFWITLYQATKFVVSCFSDMHGEIFIPKLKSIKIIDLAKLLHPKANIEIIGIRKGEKLHEILIPNSENVYNFYSFYIISDNPIMDKYERGLVKNNFRYSSENNFMNNDEMLELLEGSKLL
jgi:UDP-N-acetylglucosamine 4,6-dehydratase